ncbi:DUF4920 domain-containing protein [Shewanella violacea]|uniref:DUF4920 domain-containing protein n=1 Tax=Shewanella violacea (strain JCM 10179 / CIP 106290 / LMG 19151 / DSS12) TaxID=637905 RepID=D4ZM88_SHEVD|nr:DUF4920 domain-containing protein [Shewanella violacea]BAJ02787.1 hypothetical protein SVI_2816 [Shewanella violacea DSS12]
MKYFYGLLAAALMSICVQAKVQEFGDRVDDSNLVEISTILAQPEDYLNEPVTIGGTIIGVCEKKGCWMELASDSKFEKLRIKVRDGDMVFPVSTKGRQAIAKGQLNPIHLDLSQTKHYLAMQAERKHEDFEPNSVTEALTLYQLVPSGVKILD